MQNLDAAIRLARALTAEPLVLPEPDGRDRARRVVIGDPQAPLATVLGVLACRGLIGADGRLREDVALISVGDHFDWGGAAVAAQAAADGTALVRWLAAHPPDQIALIAGNHDLARVGELAGIDEATWAEAHTQATRLYGPKRRPTAEEESAFITAYPCFATVEIAARDLCGFSVDQRTLVEALLDARRLRLAVQISDAAIAVHAGVTASDLDQAGLPRSAMSDATLVCDALNASLDWAWEGWRGEPFAIPDLHCPGDASEGEGGGCLYHRPADPEQGRPDDFEGPRRRRYDPRLLPQGLTQVIGHVRDGKCRLLMPRWCADEPASDGLLRHLVTDGQRVRYARGVGQGGGRGGGEGRGLARLVFTDAGMQFLPADRVPLLDTAAIGA